MSDLRAIAYVSTATRLLSDQELEALLLEANVLNEQSAITGVLLYSGGNFMQYFEGPEASVAAAYERIRASRRHKDLIELMRLEPAQRVFPDWSMGLAPATQSELLALSSARWQQIHDEAGLLTPIPIGLQLLQGFWQRFNR